MTNSIVISDDFLARMLELNIKISEKNTLAQCPNTALSVASVAKELQALRVYRDTKGKEEAERNETGFPPTPLPMID